MKDIYIVLTRNCNLKCAHCYLDAGPGLLSTTLSQSDFEKIIDHLPKEEAVFLCLTGGEMFTIKDRVFDFLHYLNNEKKRRYQNGEMPIAFVLQTNGFWGKDKTKILPTLDKLKSLGISGLDISSKDNFHFEQGLKLEYLIDIHEAAKQLNLSVNLRGMRYEEQIFPLGRGKRLRPESDPVLYGKCSFKPFIMNDGSVFSCCAGFFKLPGNVIEEPLEVIIGRALKDERLNELNLNGIKGLAIHDGWTRQDLDKLISKYHECGFCYQYYR